MDAYHAGYTDGYQAAYSELYRTLDSDDHPASCGGHCRPCGVIKTSLETGMQRLAGMLTEGERISLARMLKRVNRQGKS